MKKTDLFHAALHLGIVLATIPVALDPITLGLGSAAVLEADHKVKGQPWERTFRDFVVRALGGMVGVAIAAFTGNLPLIG